MSTKPLYWQDMDPLVKNLADRVMQHWDPASKDPCYIYGVPRGGIYAALLLKSELPSLKMLGVPEAADIIVDDIIDSGATRDLYRSNPNTASIPFLALVDKQTDPAFAGKWVEFPWERMEAEQGPEANVVRMLQFIGEDPKREGLRETPARVVKSYKELFSGYGVDVGKLLKTFEDGVCDEMVLLKDIEVYSTCEHHLLPFYGVAHVAYIPNKKVVGISKLARLVDAFAKRLQIQERLTTQITSALDTHLQPLGSACVLEAKHFCMVCRGVGKQHSSMVTSSLTGEFRNPEVRSEFFHLIKG